MSNLNSDKSTATSMAWPVFFGVLATIAFYVAINAGLINHPLAIRYFASHPVEYITTTMFFVGLLALVRKQFEIMRQPRLDGELLLGQIPDGSQPVSECPHLLQKLAEHPTGVRNGYLGRRLQDALKYVHRTQSADGVEDQLRQLADADEARSHESYSLVRIVISTIPILGFLGTVIGITRAVAELAQIVGEISFEQAINSVVSGLSVAFDTTALALALSIILMFAMFFISRSEKRRLESAESAAGEELVGRFGSAAEGENPDVLAIRQMTGEVVLKTEDLVKRQAEIWHQSLDDAKDRWKNMAVAAERQMETSLTRALQSTIETHHQKLCEAEQQSEDRVGRYWQEMMGMLEKHTDTVKVQYDELRRQGKIMTQALDATERVIKLEDALNHNLGALRESQQLDHAVTSLTAAVSVLNSKLMGIGISDAEVHLDTSGKTGHAA